MSKMPDMPAKLVYQPVAGLVEQLAAKSPAPGGGSAAALSGAIGAALLVMVCEFTIGKKGFEAVGEDLTAIKYSLDELRIKLLTQVDEDTWAFSRFRVASKLPDSTPEEKARKSNEVAETSAQTIEVPRQTMLQCADALSKAHTIVMKGNPNTVSDAATGAEMLLAGLEGAANNVLINLLGRTDEEAKSLRAEVDRVRTESRGALSSIRESVDQKLRG
ncbi:MAG: cyclodeaminase/cyclohydrolase family protein [bacterium]|nr:cyclodeaminase/cyclohydrolase family protein [bacterium]